MIILRCIGLMCLLVLWAAFPAGAQLPEEKEESSIEALTRDVIRMKRKEKMFTSFEVSTGYETNVKFGKRRKGDTYEEALYSFEYNHPFRGAARFIFNYDLDVVSYNEITDVSNALNHLRFGLEKSLTPAFLLGGGYDLSFIYYPRSEESDFLFHKNFIFLRHKLSRKVYHQVMFERGWKNYLRSKALGETLSFDQDKERADDRQVFEYSIGSFVTRKLYGRLRARLTLNDSNAMFEDFYDYRSYDFSPRLYYRVNKKLSVNAGYVYTRKDYKSRNVTFGDVKEIDRLHYATFGMRYLLDSVNSVSLMYSYNQGTSNDPFAEYTGSGISAGWRHDF